MKIASLLNKITKHSSSRNRFVLAHSSLSFFDRLQSLLTGCTGSKTVNREQLLRPIGRDANSLEAIVYTQAGAARRPGVVGVITIRLGRN